MFLDLLLYIIFVQTTKCIFMKQVTISEFRANLLKYLKIVQRGEQMNITSKGTMLATLVPPVGQHDVAKEKLKKLAKTAEIHDVVTPIDGSWNAMK